MTRQFHSALNRMALFTAFLLAGLILFYGPFLRVAAANVFLNGIIIGTTIFGIGLCFVEMFKLLPEYKWARAYFSGRKNAALPPRLLRPVALILRARPVRISATTLNGMLEMILNRFEDSRESVLYLSFLQILLCDHPSEHECLSHQSSLSTAKCCLQDIQLFCLDSHLQLISLFLAYHD